MTIPFKETNVGEVNNVSDVLKAFQTYGKNLLSFAVNFKLNYELLPEHEKANIRRNLGDLLYVGAAIIGAIAITGMGGDDDEGMDLVEVARVRKNLPISDLWILPNVSHGAHEGETKDEFITKSKAFLSKE